MSKQEKYSEILLLEKMLREKNIDYDLHDLYDGFQIIVQLPGQTKISVIGQRTRFCCASCEKKYWRHPHWENPSTRINFHSVEEYASYERITNDI